MLQVDSKVDPTCRRVEDHCTSALMAAKSFMYLMSVVGWQVGYKIGYIVAFYQYSIVPFRQEDNSPLPEIFN